MALLILTLTACGPATYDNEQIETSLQAISKELNPEEKAQFYQAFQKIVLRELENDPKPVNSLANLLEDPEKIKRCTACMHGKNAMEIIELAQNVNVSTKNDPPGTSLEKKINHLAAELAQGLDEDDDETDRAFEKAEMELERLEEKINDALDELDDESDLF